MANRSRPGIQQIRDLRTQLTRMPYEAHPGGVEEVRAVIHTLDWVIGLERRGYFASVTDSLTRHLIDREET